MDTVNLMISGVLGLAPRAGRGSKDNDSVIHLAENAVLVNQLLEGEGEREEPDPHGLHQEDILLEGARRGCALWANNGGKVRSLSNGITWMAFMQAPLPSLLRRESGAWFAQR